MYKKKDELAEYYSLSLRTVDRIIALIRSNMGIRYPDDSIIEFGGRVRVNKDVFHDAFRYLELIKRGIAPKYVRRAG